MATAVLALAMAACLTLGCSADANTAETATTTSADALARLRPPQPITPTVLALATKEPSAVTPTRTPQPPISTDGSTVTITYTTELGFTPGRVDIKPGTTVVFINHSGDSMWPASNIHPTHAVLPKFDANTDIPPGASYSFTFDERGFWRYHNHNVPEEGGLIVVLGGESISAPAPLVMTIPDRPFETPGNIPFDDYVGLLSDDLLLEQFLLRYGPENTVHLLREAEGLINVDCHQRAHTLGRLAYENFGAAAFALSGHECHAGSFHGATEALFAERGTTNLEEDVAAICSAAPNSFFRHQCIHGVGHGLMAWTTYEIHDALPLCDRMPTETDKGSCYSGVFMENVVGGLTGIMGHTTNYLRDDDPHFPCDVVDSRYVNDCYFFQTSHMLVVFDYDYTQVAAACAEAPESAQFNCYASYGRDVGAATREDPALAVLYCGHVPSLYYRVQCIRGAAQDRFWDEAGEDDALAICAIVEEPEAKAGCYDMIIDRARDLLPTEQRFTEFCARIEEEWGSLCNLP